MKIKIFLLCTIIFLITACVSQPVNKDFLYQPEQQEIIPVKHEIKDCMDSNRVSGPFNPIACTPKNPDGVAFFYSFIVEVDGSVSHPKIICATPVDLDLSHVLEVVKSWEFPVDKGSAKRRRGFQCIQMSKQAFSENMVQDHVDK